MEANDSIIVIVSDEQNSFEPFPVKFYKGVPPIEKEKIIKDIEEELLVILNKSELNLRCLELTNFNALQGEFTYPNEESFITRRSFYPKENLTTVQFDKEEEVVEFLHEKRNVLYHIRSFKPADDPLIRRKKEPICEKIAYRYANLSKSMRPYSAAHLISRKRNFITFGSNYYGDMTYGNLLKEIASPKSKSESIVTFNPTKHKGFISIQSLSGTRCQMGKFQFSSYIEKKYLDTESLYP